MSVAPVLPQQLRSGRFPIDRDVRRRGTWKPATCLMLHLVLLELGALLLYFFTPAMCLLLSGVVIGASLILLGIVEARRGSLWLNPLSVFLLFLGVQMGPATIYASLGLFNEGSLAFARGVPAHDVAVGYFITLIGTFAMHLGLVTFRPSAQRYLPVPLNWKPHLVFLLYALGLAAIYAPKSFSFLGMFGGMLQWGCMAVLLAFAFSEEGVRGNFAMRLAFAGGVALYVAAAFFGESNSKSYTMLAVLPAIVFLTRRRQYYKWIPAAVLLLLVLYLGVVAPAVNTSRNIRQGDSYDRVMEGLRSSSPFYTGEPVPLSLVNEFDRLMKRLFEVPQVTGFMVGEVGRSGLQLGATMQDFYYAFIPRIIWPGKPPVSRGAWFTTYLGMSYSEAEATTSTGMTIVGEWYWDFGIGGVAFGMFFTGVLFSGLWRLAGSNPVLRPASMFLYVALIVNVLNLPDASAPIVAAVGLYLFFGGLACLRTVGERRLLHLKAAPIRKPIISSSF